MDYNRVCLNETGGEEAFLALMMLSSAAFLACMLQYPRHCSSGTDVRMRMRIRADPIIKVGAVSAVAIKVNSFPAIIRAKKT